MQQRNPGIYGARLSDGDAIKCPKPNNQCRPMPFGKVVLFFGVAEGIATHCLICVLAEERMALMPLSPPASHYAASVLRWNTLANLRFDVCIPLGLNLSAMMQQLTSMRH